MVAAEEKGAEEPGGDGANGYTEEYYEEWKENDMRTELFAESMEELVVSMSWYSAESFPIQSFLTWCRILTLVWEDSKGKKKKAGNYLVASDIF